MDPGDKAESSNSSSSQQKVLEGNTEAPQEGKKSSSSEGGDTIGDLPSKNPAAFGYDEVKGTRSANVDENGYSSPTSKHFASEYLVPRSSVSYEPISVPDPEIDVRGSSSYEVPRVANSPVSPPPSGYMPLQSCMKNPELYASKEKVSRSSSREKLGGLPHSSSKEIISSPRKGSRELVKTPSISKGLDNATSREIVHTTTTTCSSLGTWLSVAALVVALIALVFSITSLAVSTNRTSSSNSEMTDSLAVRVDSIQSQLQSVASQRPNCTTMTKDSCSLERANTTSVSIVKYECRTDLHSADLSVSSFSCVLDARSSELSADQLEIFFTSLLQDFDGYGCSCSYSNSTRAVDKSSLEQVECLLTFTHCF